MPNESKTKANRTHHQGEVGPLGCGTPPRKKNQATRPHHGQPPTPPTKEPPPPHLPRTTPKPPSHQRGGDNTTYYAFSNSTQYVIPPSTQNGPCSPRFVKALNHHHHRKVINLNSFKHLVPHRFGVNNKSIPYHLFNLGLMSLFKVEHSIIVFYPDGPERDPS